MIQHNHSERVDGCFRCDLSADEVRQINDSSLSIPERSTAEYVDIARREAAAAALREAASIIAAGPNVQEHLSRGTTANLLREMARHADEGEAR